MKRNLTDQEIENILQVIPINKGKPVDVAVSERNNVIRPIINDLKKIIIYPELIPQLKNEIERQYYKTLIQPGESVGILTAQSIGERQTQSTLNTFHSTGISMKTVITGVPRFAELLNATTSPKAQSCIIFFKEKYNNITQLRRRINNKIVDINLSTLTLKTEFVQNRQSSVELDSWYELFDDIYGKDYLEYNSYIRFFLNKETLYRYFLSIEEIAYQLEENFKDIKCVPSPDEEGILDVWIDLSEINNDIEYLTLEECILTYVEDNAIPEIMRTRICGISGIYNIFPEKRKDEWIVETEGSNLKTLLSLDIVDKVRTLSNNMWEIYDVLGIEAARNFLIEEFGSVVSSDGTYVNDSHIILLVDIMTYSGRITSINRYGLKKENCGPFAKASFEESLENFTKAGIFGEVEEIKGISASVVLGKNAKIGSGLCDILIDINKIISSESETTAIVGPTPASASYSHHPVLRTEEVIEKTESKQDSCNTNMTRHKKRFINPKTKNN